MAGDWIKMRTDLYRDPKVCLIADYLLAKDSPLSRYVSQNLQRDMSVTRNVTRNVTVGALVSVWGVLRHRGKRNGNNLVLVGVTVDIIDDIADLPGFGFAMASVGWVIETVDGIAFPNFFEEFNVEPSAEKNAKNAERQRRYRENRNAERYATGNVTRDAKSNAREEKRREEKNIGNTNTNVRAAEPSDFDSWWQAYPRKEAKAKAQEAWKKSVAVIQQRNDWPIPQAVRWLLAVTQEFAASPKGCGEFCPHATTWLNGARYDDDRKEWQRNGHATGSGAAGGFQDNASATNRGRAGRAANPGDTGGDDGWAARFEVERAAEASKNLARECAAG